MNDEILTVEEAARFLKVEPVVITDLLLSEALKGRQIGGEWRTTKRAIVSYVDCVPIQVACCTPAEAAAGNCCQPDDDCGC